MVEEWAAWWQDTMGVSMAQERHRGDALVLGDAEAAGRRAQAPRRWALLGLPPAASLPVDSCVPRLPSCLCPPGFLPHSPRFLLLVCPIPPRSHVPTVSSHIPCCIVCLAWLATGAIGPTCSAASDWGPASEVLTAESVEAVAVYGAWPSIAPGLAGQLPLWLLELELQEAVERAAVQAEEGAARLDALGAWGLMPVPVAGAVPEAAGPSDGSSALSALMLEEAAGRMAIMLEAVGGVPGDAGAVVAQLACRESLLERSLREAVDLSGQYEAASEAAARRVEAAEADLAAAAAAAAAQGAWVQRQWLLEMPRAPHLGVPPTEWDWNAARCRWTLPDPSRSPWNVSSLVVFGSGQRVREAGHTSVWPTSGALAAAELETRQQIAEAAHAGVVQAVRQLQLGVAEQGRWAALDLNSATSQTLTLYRRPGRPLPSAGRPCQEGVG